MAQTILHQVLEYIKTLEPEELLQVSRAVRERLVSQEEERKRQMFYQTLLASGLVRQIKTPPSIDVSRRRLAQIQGKPVSQTIIEERR
ncbi:MAG: hypothetical protein H3C34_05785 [Caldilineaceae bacterium]|nr:hypothetical protein [Caldilineaceae bacterium]